MGRELERLNQAWAARGLPRIGIRVGISTGPLVAGSIGSAQRLQYSIIGDTANTAARLESYDKDAVDAADGCRILLSEETRRHLGPDYHVEPIGSLRLKGKARPTTMSQLLGAKERGPCPEQGFDP
jgi:adenylate cyclase